MMASLGAKLSNKPVRIVLERDIDLKTTGGRHPFYSKYKVGFSSKGIINSLDVKVYGNGGCNILNATDSVVHFVMFHIDGCYKIQNLKVNGFAVETNLPSNTAFRGYGEPQAQMIIEHIMDRIARYLKLRPEAVKCLNFYKNNDLTHYNSKLHDFHINKLYKELIVKCDFEKRLKLVEEFNKTNKFKKKELVSILVNMESGFMQNI